MADHCTIRIQVREQLAEEIAAELLDAYRAGAEAMRERAANLLAAKVHAAVYHAENARRNDRLRDEWVYGHEARSLASASNAIRDLQLDPPATGEEPTP